MPAAPATPPNPSWIAIFIASVAFFTSVAGWFVVNWLAVNRENERDRKNRRLAFIRAASSLVTEIDLTPNDRFIEWCRTSAIKISGECATISNDIDEPKRARFKTACDAFCTTKSPDIEDPKSADFPKLAVRTATYGKGRGRMRDLLKEMIDCAK